MPPRKCEASTAKANRGLYVRIIFSPFLTNLLNYEHGVALDDEPLGSESNGGKETENHPFVLRLVVGLVVADVLISAARETGKRKNPSALESAAQFLPRSALKEVGRQKKTQYCRISEKKTTKKPQ